MQDDKFYMRTCRHAPQIFLKRAKKVDPRKNSYDHFKKLFVKGNICVGKENEEEEKSVFGLGCSFHINFSYGCFSLMRGLIVYKVDVNL